MNSLRFLLLIASFLLIKNESLIKNPNFQQNLNHWSHTNDNLVDVRPLKLIQNQKETLLTFNLEEKSFQGLFQSIFNLNSLQTPFLLSFTYFISNFKEMNGNFYVYVQVKFVDGSIHPIWVYPMKEKEKEWITNCVFIPYTKPIENILISVGGNPTFKSAKNYIWIKNVNIEKLKENDSLSTIQKGKCSTVRLSNEILTRYQIETDFLKSDLKVDEKDLTITTHLTVDRLNFLIDNAKSFKGPISASVFIRRFQDLVELMTKYSNHFELRKYVSFHLIYSNESENEKIPNIYPANLMRNLARKMSKTFFILQLDVSFTVNENLLKDTNNGKLL
jgi:hypothetical protein